MTKKIQNQTNKMEARKIIGWTAAIAALFLGVLRGANALFVGIRGFHLTAVSLSDWSATFVLNFVIKNPLFVGVKLTGVNGDVYIQGIKCGEVVNRYDYFMSGGRVHNIPVSVTINLARLSDSIISNINSGNVSTLTIDFDGSVSVGDNVAITIPVQKTVRWEDLR